MLAKNPPIRDRKYLDWLRTQRCELTGRYGSSFDGIDPMHIGTGGKGCKSGDDEAWSVLHSIHLEAHTRGEMTVLREHIEDDLLRAMIRAYCREKYQQYLAEFFPCSATGEVSASPIGDE